MDNTAGIRPIFLPFIVNIVSYCFTLQVTLSPENNPDTPLFTTPVGVSSYFQFTPVPNDGKVYVVRLVSTLSTLNYQYPRPESTVTATGVRAHVSFKFEPQVRKCILRGDLANFSRSGSSCLRSTFFSEEGRVSRAARERRKRALAKEEKKGRVFCSFLHRGKRMNLLSLLLDLFCTLPRACAFVHTKPEKSIPHCSVGKALTK